MKKFSNLSIRRRLTIALLCAVLISTGLVAYVSQDKSKSLLISRLQKSELPHLVQLVRNSVDGEILRMQAITRSLANNPVLINWIEQGEDKHVEKKMVEYLQNIAKDNGFSNASFVDRQSRKYWNQNGFLRALNKEQDGWFFAFKNSGKANSASVYRSSEGDVDIFVNFQQLDGIGASGVSKSFKGMVDYLNSFKIEQSGFVYLADSQGKIKVHKNDDYNEKKNITDIYQDIDTKELIAKKEFAFQSTKEFVIASSYIPSLDWYVIAQIPKSELYADLNSARNHILAIFLIITIIFLIISIYLGNSLTRPLTKMAEAFEELGKGEGDLSQKIDEGGQRRFLA